ncbi:MAG: DUF922 domain-containing protein [Zhengella sp.]|uniref:DUF922 domain-containing Zn-dependent protease n=1 Tax=Zhengella sp. TaxID=2282762 RepID=UPI0035277F6C
MPFRPLSFALFLSCLAAAPCLAAEISTAKKYYQIGGATVQEIQRQLERHGPRLGGHKGHPAATRMEFKTRVEYAEKASACRISQVRVRLVATMTLPRWKRPGGASPETARFWNALDQDILRHENHHVDIAADHARKLERALDRLPARNRCAALEKEVGRVTDRIMKANDEAHAAFDRKEGNEFERRLEKLIARRGRSTN